MFKFYWYSDVTNIIGLSTILVLWHSSNHKIIDSNTQILEENRIKTLTIQNL